MLVGLFYQLVNVNMLYQDYNGPGEARSNILLYQACYNPWAHFSKSLFKMIGISEIMVLALGWLNISCNIFLYRFLESHRKNNVAGNMIQIKWYDTCFLVIRCTDIKKERKRNLIPAKVGIQSVCIVGGASILYSILLGLQVHKYQAYKYKLKCNSGICIGQFQPSTWNGNLLWPLLLHYCSLHIIVCYSKCMEKFQKLFHL